MLKGKGYDPNQPRDKDGKWTAAGAGAAGKPKKDLRGPFADKTQGEISEMLRGYPAIDFDSVERYIELDQYDPDDYMFEYMQQEVSDRIDELRQEWYAESPEREFLEISLDTQAAIEESARDELREEARNRLQDERREAEEMVRQSVDEVYSVSGTGKDGREWETAGIVTSVFGDGDIHVEGEFYVEGEYAGKFRREITGGSVYRALLQVGDEYAGLGIASAFNHQEEMAYMKSGIPRVRLSAMDLSNGDPNKPPGTYVWGSQGYDFDYGAPSSVKNAVQNYIDNNPEFRQMPPILRDTVTDVAVRLAGLQPTDPDYPTPREITQLGRLPGESWWAGKSIMAHSGASFEQAQTGRHEGPAWDAVKQLDDPAGLRVSLGEIRSEEARERAVRQHVAAWRATNPQLPFEDDFVMVDGNPVPIVPTDAMILEALGL